MYAPESRALFLPGAKSWQKRFRNVGKETLVKGFGGRTRAGRKKGSPRRAGHWRGLRASMLGLGGVTLAPRGAGALRAHRGAQAAPALTSVCLGVKLSYQPADSREPPPLSW